MIRAHCRLAAVLIVALLAASLGHAALPGQTAPPVRWLNNLVAEVLTVENPARYSYRFTAPREGFVWVQAQPAATAAPTVKINSRPVVLRPVGANFEGMVRLPAGQHRIAVSSPVRRLTVRAVGDLVYMVYGSGPWLKETGDYTWTWLRRHVLDNYNVIIGADTEGTQEAEINEWTGEGKEWMTGRNLLWGAKSADEVVAHLTAQTGMSDPRMSGVWGDEFLPLSSFGAMAQPGFYDFYAEALRRVKADPRYRGHRFYAYTGSAYSPEMRDFVRAVVETGGVVAREWYCLERPKLEDIPGYFGPAWELANRKEWEAAHPEAGNHRLIALSILSQPPESCDGYPSVNYDAFLDMQMQYLATAPAFKGTVGLQGYYSIYAGEEVTRLLSRLLRHYAIEGRTDRFLSDPYMLTHLQNGDFVEGTKGWELAAAAPDSIKPVTAKGFGALQGRFDKTGLGDTALLTRRSAAKPNRFVQTVRDLQPGRLYTLRFITGNYQDLLQVRDNSYQHAVTATLEGVALVPGKCFSALSLCHPGYTTGGFGGSKLYRSNYHQLVFRARGATARLTFSDWASDATPGGPEGEELLWNFVQVQPYFSE
jgi:hypothetical protein